MALRAVELLFAHLGSKESARWVVPALPELVMRESSGVRARGSPNSRTHRWARRHRPHAAALHKS
nr:hypothetical protein [Caballeronia pedi]